MLGIIIKYFYQIYFVKTLEILYLNKYKLYQNRLLLIIKKKDVVEKILDANWKYNYLEYYIK